MKKLICNIFIILIMSPVLGTLLLVLVHLLPTQPMKEHLYSSVNIICKKIESEVSIEGYSASLSGIFTDCLMLEHAIYNNTQHSAFSQAMHMYRAEAYYDAENTTVWWPGVSLLNYLNEEQTIREVEYSRYWHGYLIVLKPLLFVTSLGSIQLLNAAMEITLLGLALILICLKVDGKLAVAFIISIPYLYFFGMYCSLSLSICFYLAIISIIAMLIFKEYLEKNYRYTLFFLIIGISTAYFDFLTFPLLVLGFPLVIYGYLYFQNDWKDMNKVLGLSVMWGMGYGFMWASKWIITDLFFGEGIIQNAIMTLFTRTSKIGENRMKGIATVLKSNLQPFINWGFLLFIILLLIVFLGGLFINSTYVFRFKIRVFLMFIAIALMPVAWYFFTENHSSEHWMFTCKIFSVSVFSFGAGVGRSIEKV